MICYPCEFKTISEVTDHIILWPASQPKRKVQKGFIFALEMSNAMSWLFLLKGV